MNGVASVLIESKRYNVVRYSKKTDPKLIDKDREE